MRMPLFAVFVALTTLSAAACGDGDLTDVDIPFTIPVVTDQTFDAGSYCTEHNKVCDKQDQGEVQLPIEPQTFEFKTQLEKRYPDIKDYIKAIRAVTIEEVEYSVSENTLTKALPSSDIYVGPVKADKYTGQGVVKLIELPEIGAGKKVTNGKATADKADKQAAGKILIQDQFKLFPVLNVNSGGVSGKIKLSAKAKVVVTVNLADTLSAAARQAVSKVAVNKN